MKIVHISTYAFAGGAARAAYRLHDGLKRCNTDSSMIVCAGKSAGNSVIRFKVSQRWLHKARRYLRGMRIQRDLYRYNHMQPEGLELFSTDHSRYGVELAKALPPCDVIHLHWIAGFVDLQQFFAAIPSNQTVIWTLHDMNAFSGGCHYDLGCGRYQHGCGQCPQLGSSDNNDLSAKIWRRKLRIFSQISPKKLIFAAPSRWLTNEIKRSPLLSRFQSNVIPYGIDTDEFFPRNKESAREALGINPDANVILFLAHNVRIKRKGLELLHQALALIQNKTNFCLLSIGHDSKIADQSFQHIHLGRIENDRLLASVISAAGLFVIPSQQDNLPNTVLEAMACGTPVLGFNTGGIPDMVREGVTGHLVANGDVKALSGQIVNIFNDPKHTAKLSDNCRRVAVEEYALHVSAKRYLDLYKHATNQ